MIVITGQVTIQDFMPVPEAVGVVRGVITDTATGQPVTATISAPGTPVSQDAYGAYQFALPADTYTLEARGLGYRVLTATVTIVAGQVTEHSFPLVPAPRVLLVNSGAYYGDEYPQYFRSALNELGYAYAEWDIRQLPDDTPTITDLLKYDLVIWSSPDDSPGYIGADRCPQVISFQGTQAASDRAGCGFLGWREQQRTVRSLIC